MSDIDDIIMGGMVFKGGGGPKKDDDDKVKKGDKVKAGQVIGLTGRTGRATTEHLHFEVSFDGKRLDPAFIFDHSNHKLKAATLHLTKGKGVKSVKN